MINFDNTIKTTNKENNNKWWHIPVSGAISGSIASYLNFPFEGIKKRLESGQPTNFKPRELYRGVNTFAASVTPATIIQMTCDNNLNYLLGNNNSIYSPILCAALSGAIGAIVSTPVENTILAQQLNKTGPLNAIKILTKHSFLRPWTGYKSIAIRESGFALSMLWGADAAGKWLSNYTNRDLYIPGSITVGIMGAIITHPFDVIATNLQCKGHSTSLYQTASHIYHEKGIKGFYPGCFWRSLLFTGCMLTMQLGKPIILNMLQNKERKEHFANIPFFKHFKKPPINSEKLINLHNTANNNDQNNIIKPK